MRLDRYSTAGFDRGASKGLEALWLIVSGLLVASWLPGSGWRVRLLRWFGAQVGRGVVIKPGVRIKFPWRLVIGDHCWIGEQVWIDNLAEVRLESHVCLSQGAYLCTGSHDWSHDAFDLVTKPILLEDQTWICASAQVAPGTRIRRGAVLGLGAFGRGELQEWTIYSGNPARPVARRLVGEPSVGRS